MSSNTTVDIYTTPAGPPPPGQVSNLVNPFYLRTISLTTHALCLAISTIAVALRIFTKVHVMKQFRSEDYALILAQLIFIPWIVLNFVAPGAGHHLWDISVYTSIQLSKYVNYIIILYGPPVFFAKLSVLLQLQHIFVVSHRQPIFFIIQALIWANMAFYLAYFFIDIFQCVPRQKIWNPTVSGRCISTDVLLIAPAGINIVSDCLILVLPIVLVFRLKMTLEHKLAIVTIFSSGLFAVVSSVMRLVYSIKLTQYNDIFWAIYPVAMWAAAELATVVLAATIPTMPRLWAFIRTGGHDTQQIISNERRSTPYPPYRPRHPTHLQNTASLGDNLPLNGDYRKLQGGTKKKGRKEELEMSILKTETYEVTSRMKDLPELP